MVMNSYLDGDVAVISVDIKHLDGSTLQDFASRLDPLVERHKKIVLDLAEVQFIDSSGIGLIMGVLRNIREDGGEMHFANVADSVLTVMDLMKVERFLTIFPTIEQAVASFRS